LINANNDEHIWAEDYDRDLTDVRDSNGPRAQKMFGPSGETVAKRKRDLISGQPKIPTRMLSFRRTITQRGRTCFATRR
jgi:hypothetical protein